MVEPVKIQKRFDELKLTGALPSPTGVGLAILRITQGDDYCMGDITKALESDPSLSGRILKLANSAHLASSQPARTVNDAAMRLGVRVVRNVALGFSLVSGHRSGPCSGFDYETYWSSALASGIAAQFLTRFYEPLVPAEAFTCGLLSGIGRLALASIHPTEYGRVLEQIGDQSLQRLIVEERKAFELDHAELTKAMMADWKLPAFFGVAAACYESFDAQSTELEGDELRMTEVLFGGSKIAAVCRSAAEDEATISRERVDELERLRCSLGLGSADFFDLCDEIAEAWQEWGEMLEVPTSDVPSFEEIAARARAQERSFRQLDAPREQRSGVNSLRVLVVDDDPMAQKLLVHRLTREGHTVMTANDGEEGLALALDRAPDLILTDWRMPRMDGVELCRALRRSERGDRMFILVLTGEDDEDQIVTAFEAGADDYVIKPFNPKILMARVRAGARLIELQARVAREEKQRAEQMSQLALLNRKLHSAALTDSLTGLPNRRFATQMMQQEIERTRSGGTYLSVMMLDVDHFKRVNDDHGHDVGDQVLRETARVLRRGTRKGDVVCRMGGEEFLVVCRGCELSDALRSAERLRLAVEGHRPQGMMSELRTTVSIGVASLGESNGSMDGLLKLADERAYVAKKTGRNRVWGGEPRLPRSA